MNIEKLNQFLQNKYVWPGGYTLHAVMGDGGLMCHKCCKENERLLYSNLDKDGDHQWRVVGLDVNWEAVDLQCDNCYESIQPEYPVN
jgi:hypothetical protein